MLSVLTITFPIFAIIGLGFGTARARLFEARDQQALGKFVMNIALPALLFHALSQRSFAEVFDPAYLVAYGGGTVVLMALALGWFRISGIEPSRRAVAVLGVSASNSGYVGYPILLLAHPDVAGRVLALNMMLENFLVVPFCLALMAAEGTAKVSAGRFVRNLALDMLKRPLILALFAGLAVSLTGVPVPGAASRLVAILSTATAPLALFYIGGSLAGLPIRGNWQVAAQIVIGKLFLHPLLVWLAVLALPVLGLSLDPALAAPAVLMAAMPMLGIYALLAAEKGHEGMASIALLSATAVAFLSVSFLLTVLG